jgi:hypothetical protein
MEDAFRNACGNGVWLHCMVQPYCPNLGMGKVSVMDYHRRIQILGES